MICQRCGRDTPPEYSYCQACGNPLIVTQYPPPMPDYAQATGNLEPVNFANIGARFIAALIDGVVLGIPIGIISMALSAMMAARVIHRTSRDTSFNPGMAAEAMGTFFAGFGFIMILSVLLSWAYFAIMESSRWQGTLGKKAMGIRVTDLNGSRITLGRATIRLAVKAFLSGWFLLGYIMAFFTQKKQALHDLIAGTLVLTTQIYAPATPAGYSPQYQPPSASAQQTPVYVPPQPDFICPNCGRLNQPNSRFCTNCGHNL